MKRFFFVGLVALGLAATARPVKADCAFEYSCSRHLSYVHTSKNRCFNFNSYSRPLPEMCHSGSGYSGPAWGGPPVYGYPAPVAAAPVAAAPAAAPAPAAPSFNAPAPKQTPNNNSTSLQQAGYFYYGQTANPSYGSGSTSSTGYMYYGYGSAGYYQAPNYWYDN